MLYYTYIAYTYCKKLFSRNRNTVEQLVFKVTTACLQPDNTSPCNKLLQVRHFIYKLFNLKN